MSEVRISEVVLKLARGHRFRILIVILISIVLGLGLLIPIIEQQSEGAMILTEGNGIYFAVTTVTGVGYGDMVPVTNWGRIIAIILQTVGVVLFGSIVAMVAVELLRYQEDFYVRRMLTRIDELEMKLSEIKKHLDFLVKK